MDMDFKEWLADQERADENMISRAAGNILGRLGQTVGSTAANVVGQGLRGVGNVARGVANTGLGLAQSATGLGDGGARIASGLGRTARGLTQTAAIPISAAARAAQVLTTGQGGPDHSPKNMFGLRDPGYRPPEPEEPEEPEETPAPRATRRPVPAAPMPRTPMGTPTPPGSLPPPTRPAPPKKIDPNEPVVDPNTGEMIHPDEYSSRYKPATSGPARPVKPGMILGPDGKYRTTKDHNAEYADKIKSGKGWEVDSGPARPAKTLPATPAKPAPGKRATLTTATPDQLMKYKDSLPPEHPYHDLIRREMDRRGIGIGY